MDTLQHVANHNMLCSLNISMWGVSKHDREASRKVANENGADQERVKVIKKLVDSSSCMKKLTTLAGTARNNTHYALTVPFARGNDILPGPHYFKYTKEMHDYEQQWRPLVKEFCEIEYLDLLSTQKGLGTLAKASDYPSPDKIRHKFGFGYRLFPMPTTNFPKGLESFLGSELQAVAMQAQSDIEKAFDAGKQDVLMRVNTQVNHVLEKMKGYTGSRQGAFRDSLIENLDELVALIPGLNITNDPVIDSLTKEIKDGLCFYSAEDLRNSDVAREITIEKAEAILAHMQDYL